MTNWRVRLIGEADIIEKLIRFSPFETFEILRHEDFYELASQSWLSLPHAESVLASSEVLLRLINGLAHLELGATTTIEPGRVENVRPDGSRDVTVVIKPASLVITTFPPDVRGTASPSLKQWLSLSQSDAAVEKVLRLYTSRSPDWVDMYRMYEVVEGDAGGESQLIGNSWVTRKNLHLFKQTANSVGALGDAARHGKENTLPPSAPMTRQEAKQLIDGLLRVWVSSKTNP